jgi:hypothetical protein
MRAHGNFLFPGEGSRDPLPPLFPARGAFSFRTSARSSASVTPLNWLKIPCEYRFTRATSR